ncbi:IS110 family transposase [Streptomyces sp. 3211]|uniref:IS110 family transposase n=1 Tax=Streptomyces sp. 3211 TaxID=1964449 RepID=UPI001F3EDC31|nr:IS110 family transposase [Streptomyces sp. 3211]
MASLVAESGSQLTDTPGIGAVTAVRLPSRTGKPTRFPTSSAVAQYTSTAPIEIASADRARRGLMGATELGNARSVAASR